jgi:hypothetical protein
MDYKALEEEWGEYVLPNGIHLKTRAVLVFVRQGVGEPDDDGMVEVYHEARSTLNVGVMAPEDLTGDPSGNEGEPEIVDQFEDFETVRNPRSIYYVEDTGTFLVIEADPPDEIALTNHYDENGEPVLRVSQPRDLRSTGPPHPDIEEKLAAIAEEEGIDLPPSPGDAEVED